MDFYALLDQIVDLLRSRQRVTYRTLKRQFNLEGADFSWGRAGIATKTRYAFGILSQGCQRRLCPDAMPTRQHTR